MTDQRRRAARQYLESRVRGASPAELVSILYEGFARELHTAAAALGRRDLAEAGSAIGVALGILGHLRASVDHEAGGTLATNLERLYVWWTSRITEANARSQRGPLDEVLAQLDEVRAAWEQAVVGAVKGKTSAASASTAQALRPAAAGTRG